MRLGVIGYGNRISLMVRDIIQCDPRCRVTAVADIQPERVKQRIERAGFPIPRFYEYADDMLDSETLDGVLVGTRCSLHAEMALKVLKRGIPLFLEKPVATTLADWLRLKEAADRATSPVVVSFPLRLSKIVQFAKEVIQAGTIGKVEHVQAINNVPYGGVYYHNWYRDERETGGLFMQKATHDFDYIQYLVEESPVRVCAVTSKQIFRGTKPAGLRCSRCDERDCPERVHVRDPQFEESDYCCFAQDTGNEDSGSAIVQYASGMHAVYTHNFFARRKAGVRGARLTGFKGTLKLDFYTNSVRIDLHHVPRSETYEFETEGRHFGGDAALAQNFVDVLYGKAVSRSTLSDGLLSALICLKAKEAASTHTYQELEWIEPTAPSARTGTASLI
jgi:predicted dehydrogenase